MKPSEFVFNKNISNRDKFGAYVRGRMQELGVTLRAFAEELGVSPAYVSDIEKGNRKAPLEYLEKMATLLAIEEDEKEFFVDLSGCTHSNWPEINEYLATTKGARDAIRLARDLGMTEEEFLAAVSQLSEETQNEEKKQVPLESEK